MATGTVSSNPSGPNCSSHASGKAVAASQDSTEYTFAPFIKRDFTEVDWDTWDAYRLDRVHRAASHHVCLSQNVFRAASLTVGLSSARSCHRPPLFSNFAFRGVYHPFPSVTFTFEISTAR